MQSRIEDCPELPYMAIQCRDLTFDFRLKNENRTITFLHKFPWLKISHKKVNRVVDLQLIGRRERNENYFRPHTNLHQRILQQACRQPHPVFPMIRINKDNNNDELNRTIREHCCGRRRIYSHNEKLSE